MDSEENKTIWTPANIVTLVRILLIPVFVAVLLSPWPDWLGGIGIGEAWQPWAAGIVFAAISATDAIDGHLARSRNEVTTLGKFMDPIADKLLVAAALLALVELGSLPSWIVLIIISREFLVSGLRMVAASEGQVIAASYFGKAKTVLQIAAVLMFIVKDARQWSILGGGVASGFTALSWVVMAAAVIMTIVSMLDYFYKARFLFKNDTAGSSEGSASKGE